MSDTRKFLIALLLGLLTVFVIDPMDMSTVSTPFCLGIILMGISLRHSVQLVAMVSVIYCVLTIYALVRFHRYYEAHTHIFSPHPYFWLFQRMGLFIVLCGLSIYLAYYRTDTERILGRLRAILSKLPAPVILSDASGIVSYANDAVVSALNREPSEIIGRSYFEYLLTDSTKGKSIRTYFELFESDTNGVFAIEVNPFGQENRMTAQLICLGTGQNRMMITVLQTSEKSAFRTVPA